MSHRKSQTRIKKLKNKEKKNNEENNQYFEDIKADESFTKDFEFLVNAPISEDNFFVSKAEKSWNVVDVSKYSEYFMLDLTTLSAVIESIPFNSNVNINSKYFTYDQMTSICNKAEDGKAKYNQILNKLEEQVSNDIKSVEGSQDLVEDTTEDLDFLLSLEEPVNDLLTIVKS
ncbi:uncharacterized protein LOC128894040 [Hylaeus anthracinus]|uniref:uncharacterized protein LOC128894040 n=1 Tax=Hylaeus anthracinus TaxID=313031 RepID=UPI0023B8ABBF|nr:uncharacterized protein LOC128894040 [Hylaeus anthracinus]